MVVQLATDCEGIDKAIELALEEIWGQVSRRIIQMLWVTVNYSLHRPLEWVHSPCFHCCMEILGEERSGLVAAAAAGEEEEEEEAVAVAVARDAANPPLSRPDSGDRLQVLSVMAVKAEVLTEMAM